MFSRTEQVVLTAIGVVAVAWLATNIYLVAVNNPLGWVGLLSLAPGVVCGVIGGMAAR